MKKVICECGQEMAKVGLLTDNSLGKVTKRVKYVCQHCGNEAFLDPKKWEL